MANIYPVETLAYVNENISLIKPAAFSAAVEKLDAATKAHVRQLRKNYRKLKQIN